MARTLRGRVVYNRKKHVFKKSDVDRIMKKVISSPVTLHVNEEYFIELANRIKDFVFTVAGEIEERVQGVFDIFTASGNGEEGAVGLAELENAGAIIIYRRKLEEEE